MGYIPYASSYIWQNITEPAKSIKPGHIYLFWYNRHQHDWTPMALIMKYEKEYNTFQAINFHYIHPNIRVPLLRSWDRLGLVNRDSDAVHIDYELIKTYVDDASIFLRRYKLDAISSPRLIPLDMFEEKYYRSYGHVVNASRPLLWNLSLKQFATRPAQGLFRE